jgi:hypothetical protein
MSAGMTRFPMSPGAPRNNKGEAVEEFIAATCKVSKGKFDFSGQKAAKTRT